MKIYISALVIPLLCVTMFSQQSPADKKNQENETAAETPTEEAKKQPEPQKEPLEELEEKEEIQSQEIESKTEPEPEKEESDFVNPFATTDEEAEAVSDDAEKSEDTSDTVENPFLAQAETSEVEDDAFEDEEGGLDFLVDLAVGVSLPRLEIKPDNITSEGRPSFLFNAGIIIPFAKWFYGGISVRYLQFAFNLSKADTTKALGSVMQNEFDTREKMTFVSAPIQLGMRFEIGLFTPYFYADIEPAYMTGGHQFAKVTTNTMFMNGDVEKETYNADIDLTDLREELQLFVGGGIGLEMSYGYGAIYVDGSFQWAPKQIDKSTDLKSLPLRTSSKALYFPVTIGIRFFL